MLSKKVMNTKPHEHEGIMKLDVKRTWVRYFATPCLMGMAAMEGAASVRFWVLVQMPTRRLLMAGDGVMGAFTTGCSLGGRGGRRGGEQGGAGKGRAGGGG